MAKGISAAVVLISLILSISILSGLGFYADLDAGSIDAGSQNEDVVSAADQLDGVNFGEDRGSSILQGPLAVVVPVINMAMAFVTVIGNTSGVLQLLFGVPKVAADALELFFRIGMVVTIIYLIRSGSPV
jgi:hypothetical protein